MEEPTTVIKRSETHGEDMACGEQNNDRKSASVGSPSGVHCHDCWKYTDDVTLQREMLHAAVGLIINSGTLAVENSEAFKAADAFVASRFRNATPLTMPCLR